MVGDNSVDLKLSLDISGVNDALYQMINQFNGTDKEFQKIANSIQKNAKNLEAAIKLFGPASQQAGAAVKKIERDFQSLVANGIDPASASFKKMTASMPTSSGLDATTSSLKKNNMQWNNLALVIQDLPFGLRGIQNNLPALVGGFAAATGPIYLAISAVVAAVTAWDMGLFNVKKSTKQAKEEQDSYNESIKTAISSVGGEISKVQSLVSVVNNQTIAVDKRRLALKKLQDEYPEYFKNMSLEKTSVDGLSISVGKLTEALIARAEASAMTGEIEKKAAQRYENTKQIQKNELAITNLTNSLTILSKESQYVSGGFGAGAKKLASPYTLALAEIQKLTKANKELGISNEALQNSMSLLQNSVNFRTGTSIGLETNAPKSGGKGKNPALEAQIQEGKDIMYIAEKNTKEFEELEKAQAEGARRAGMAGGNIEYIKEPELDPKARAKAFAEKMAFDKKMSKERVDQLKQQYQLEVSEAIGSFDQIKTAEENMRNALNKGFMDGTIKLDEYLTAIQELRKKSNKTVSEEAKAAMEETLKIGIGIMNALGPALDMLLQKGANIGEVISRAFTDVIKKLTKVAIAAAIAVAIMSMIPGLIQPGKGFATFGNLISQGMGLPTLFANGGVVSGPTLGLMGEYPGASSNPEVVAPLDKLKDMMGSGGGTLETRISGNDLLILVNKANRNNSNTF